VSFKRFRYGTEALQHVLPGIAPSMLKAMDRYQLRMGVIQDLEVFTAAFRRYLSRVRRGMHINLLPFQQELAREHQTRVREFLAGAGELNSFWTLAKQTERRHKQTSSLHQPSLN
jgi:CHAD domain-containing protein